MAVAAGTKSLGEQMSKMLCAVSLILTFASSSLHAQDCVPADLEAARARIFDEGKLRPTFLSSDVVRLAACDADGSWLSEDELRSISTGYEPFLINEGKLEGKHLVEGRVCIAGKCTYEVYYQKGLKPAPGSFSMGGGLPFASFLGHLGTKGHFEITKAALSAPSIIASTSSAAIMAAASRDADYFEWNIPAAHGQTRSSAEGLLDQSGAEARDQHQKWLAEALKRVSTQCKAKAYREAAYSMGYALHGVQDFVFHEGISNAEHSYRDNGDTMKVGVDYADRYDMKFSRATALSIALLERVRGLVTNECWLGMTQLKVAKALKSSEKEEVLGRSMDFGPIAFFEYRGLASKVNRLVLQNVESAKLFISPRWITDPASPEVQTMLKQAAEGAR